VWTGALVFRQSPAVLPQAEALSAAERTLMREWLDRFASQSGSNLPGRAYGGHPHVGDDEAESPGTDKARQVSGLPRL
jgi:hypothetical protein